MTKPAVILQPGKDKAVRNRHHWIFSGAVRSLPSDAIDGGIYAVQSAEGELLGHAYLNRRCSIIGRMISFGPGDPFMALEANVLRALALRKDLFGDGQETDAYRLINAEGDGLPGLVVDRYAGMLVVQIATLGMEKIKRFLVDILIRETAPESIYEKSNLPARREEGLADEAGVLYGRGGDNIRIRENGLAFVIDVLRSQKTGFYLDQREMRQLAASLAKGRNVLNGFSYTGGFSVYALRGGAVRVDSVDTSAQALEKAKENFILNGFSPQGHGFFEADVFEYLRRAGTAYDLVILDPPAFARKKSDALQACRGYKDINRIAFQKVSPGGYVMTFSCSHFVDERLFQQVVFQAAREASRNVRILQKHRQAPDHPINIYHPETEYLKGFLLYVD